MFIVSASSPVMVKGPKNMTALDGKDATVHCVAEGAPAPNVTWYFNGKTIKICLDEIF